MENLPILKYAELVELWHYGHMNELSGSVADDASLEVMLRIEKTMNRLKVMGDDDRRIIWIRLKAPHRKADRDSWFFTLRYSVGCYSDDMISILKALLDKGIKVYCDDTGRLLRIDAALHDNTIADFTQFEAKLKAAGVGIEYKFRRGTNEVQ